MNASDRLHALDNLRALMMWLGIVLHAAILYTATPTPFPFHDRATSTVADLLMLFIHSFRMLVFFVLAGFFAAMLARRDGAAGMLRQRLRRIGLPFVIFWPLLFAATVLAIMLGAHVIARGALGIDASLMKPPPPGAPMLSTMHLWFLYYLLIYCAAAAAILKLAKGRDATPLHDGVARIGAAWWGCLLLSLSAALCGFGHAAGIVPNRTSFLPYPDELFHNGVFFAFGWLLYARRDALLAHYRRRCWHYLVAGLVLFMLYLALLGRYPGAGMPREVVFAAAWMYGCVGWLLGFAAIGLFVRYASAPNAALAYLARSAYWVYLLHLPVTVAVGAVLYLLDAGAPLKMLLNIGATTALCLASYELLVRRSAIGRLLNGAPRAAAPTTPAGQPALP